MNDTCSGILSVIKSCSSICGLRDFKSIRRSDPLFLMYFAIALSTSKQPISRVLLGIDLVLLSHSTRILEESPPRSEDCARDEASWYIARGIDDSWCGVPDFNSLWRSLIASFRLMSLWTWVNGGFRRIAFRCAPICDGRGWQSSKSFRKHKVADHRNSEFLNTNSSEELV